MCDCLKITFQDLENDLPLISFQLSSIGTYNSFDVFSFTYYGTTYYIWFNGTDKWFISTAIGSITYVDYLNSDKDCPVGNATQWQAVLFNSETEQCESGCDNEDRIYKEYSAIKLPKTCIEEDRGMPDCCCEQLVLSSSSSDTWKNDKTPVWIKLSDPADSFDFKLYKDNVLTSYTLTPVAFPNEPNAYYAVINWQDVYTSDGIGCYELKREWDISGIIGTDTWGHYKLLQYSIQNALTTARVRAIFNLNQEVEGINFTGANVEGTLRFNGYIGNIQPNMEIDNLIYNNREMKSNLRENLTDYEILVDPTFKCITSPLINLYLLSENELFISDYNAHNHDYCIKDLPVIVSESPEMIYYDFSRKAGVKAKVSDKFKNKRTYY